MTDYLWLDLETTGLDPKTRRIIEVACILTKDDMVPYGSYESVVYQNPNVGWDDVAKEMHQKSGLFNRVQTEGKDERVVITDLTSFLINFLKKPDKKIILAGNTVHFDRSHISEQWPVFMPWLSHRHLDVSSFKVYAEGLGVKKHSTETPAHRAMDDIQNSLKEFAYYVAEIKKLP